MLAPPRLPDYNDIDNRLSPVKERAAVMPLVLAIVAFVSLLYPCGPLSAMDAETFEPASLWHAASPAALDPNPGQRRAWVLREREIAVDEQILQILKDATARPHPRVSVEFFDGTAHELDITSTVS